MATIAVVIKEIQAGLKQLGETNKLLRLIATDFHRVSSVRIFEDGIKSNGSSLGNYAASTKLTRARFNRPTGKITLEFTGQFKRSYITAGRSKIQWDVGFIEVSRRTITGKSDSTTNAEIREFLEAPGNFGAIFDPTSEEDDNIDLIIDEFLGNINF